jgi:hypothetical protein
VTKPEVKYVQAIERLIGKEIAWADKFQALPADHTEPAKEAGSSRRRPERGGRGGRAGKRGRPHRETAPREEAKSRSTPPVKAGEPQLAEHSVRRSKELPRKPQQEKKSEGGAGFNDHVPAFLLRPVRVPRAAEAMEDA